MICRASSERGLTMIELMAVTAIIGILSATSMQTFSVLKGQAYDALTDSEEGVFEWWEYPWAWTNSNGSFSTGYRPVELAPGLVNPKHLTTYISHSAWCQEFTNSPWCQVNYVSIYNCKSGTSKSWWRASDGTNYRSEWSGAPTC